MKMIQERDSHWHAVCPIDIRQRDPLITLSNFSHRRRVAED